MADPRLADRLDALHRDLDLVVFALERLISADVAALVAERTRVRRDLERLRDELADVIRTI